MDNEDPRAVGVLGVVCHLDMAQERYSSFQMCLVACSRSSNSSQLLCFPALFCIAEVDMFLLTAVILSYAIDSQ